MLLEVEIGCGKGKFLVARACENPHIRFLGIDKAGRFLKRGILRGQKRGLENLEFVKGDIRIMLHTTIMPESVEIFHIYFPDPWPKRRHRDRRLLQRDFLALLHSRLKKGGLIEVATDDRDYFDAIKNSASHNSLVWKEMRESVNERLMEAILPTNYEMKYKVEGRPIYYLELQK